MHRRGGVARRGITNYDDKVDSTGTKPNRSLHHRPPRNIIRENIFPFNLLRLIFMLLFRGLRPSSSFLLHLLVILVPRPHSILPAAAFKAVIILFLNISCISRDWSRNRDREFLWKCLLSFYPPPLPSPSVPSPLLSPLRALNVSNPTTAFRICIRDLCVSGMPPRVSDLLLFHAW